IVLSRHHQTGQPAVVLDERMRSGSQNRPPPRPVNLSRALARPVQPLRELHCPRRNVQAMGSANAPGWRYTASYGWNWRSARAIGRALGSLALPMPPWFRAVVARCLVTRTALHADARGIWGSAGPGPAGPDGPCPWKDVTDIVVWDYDHLRIIGLARRGDAVGGGPAA